jgi:TonB family protein
MNSHRLRSLSHVCFGVLTACVNASAFSQPAVDTPAALVSGSCARLDFNRALISQPVAVDLLIQVDERGKAVSVAPLAEVRDSSLLSAAITSAQSCSFRPAIREGKSTAGTVRLAFEFSAAAAAPPLGRRATIANPRVCAPTADDYPAASRQLNETGTTRISFTLSPEGHLTAFGVVRSSGHLRLDFTALIKLAGCKFTPAKAADGTSISSTLEVEYVWKLE